MINLKKWLAQRKTKKHREQAITLCQQFYHAISGFHLAKEARTQQQLFSYEYVYGEINFSSFAQLLARCQITSDSIFYDLGAGTGKAVICAAMLYDFKKVCGIEQLHLLHECAEQIQQKASLHLLSKNIYFHKADLLTFDWHDADIIFINATAFIGEFWQQVLAQLKQLKNGVQIIVVSKLLPEDHFTPIYNDFLPMSWGLARVGIYTKIKR